MILTLTTRQEGGTPIVDAVGRMVLGNTLSEAEAKMRAVVAGGQTSPVLNLEKVDYIDSAGVGTIVAVAGLAHQAGGQLRVVGANPRVMGIFKMTRVDTLLSIHESVAAALSQALDPRDV